MPFVTVLMLKGRTLDQRRHFAEAVTQLAVDSLGAKADEVRVHFVEMAATDFARAGRLTSDQG
jgi:4-oxalocrotonate tautomerase